MVSPGRSADKPPEGQVAFFSPYLWIAVLFLVLGPVSGVNSNPTLVKGMVGGSVTLPLNISTFSEIEHVTWNGPQKALVLVPSTGNAIFMDKLNQDRLSVNNQNYSLSIYKLTQKDVGTYKAQINRKTSEITAEEEFTLLIYERLQKPQVTVKSVAISKDASCTVTLLCSVEGTDVSYSWIPRVSNVSESYGNSTVTLSWTPCDPDQHYTCKARNLVSQVNSSSIFIQHVCSDPDTSEGRPVAGLLGESVTLPLALPAHQGIKGVIWVFNTSIINKVPAPVTASPLKSSQDFSLKIDSVTMKDAGTYQAFLCSKASKVIHSERITLHVYRRLQKPSITWNSPGPLEGGVCRVSLTCSVEDSNVTYTWSPLQKGAMVSQGGSRLTVCWRSGDTHPTITCTASNPVSNSSQKFVPGDICPAAPKKERNIVIGVSVFFTLCFAGIAVWYIWKKKRCGSAPTTNFSQEKSPDVTQDSTMGFSRCRLSRGYDMLGMTPRTAGKQPPSDCSSSDSNLTTEEDEERKVMHMAGPGRDQAHGQVTQGKPKQESKLTTPGSMTPLFEVKGDTVYTQVFFNSQGKTPLSQENENSATIYSSVQGLQEVGPPVRQHGAKSPDISNYENLT